MTDKKQGKYDDILYLNRPTSGRHPQMPLSDRAAQFAPFAALPIDHIVSVEREAAIVLRRFYVSRSLH